MKFEDNPKLKKKSYLNKYLFGFKKSSKKVTKLSLLKSKSSNERSS